MGRTTPARAIRIILASFMLFGVGGGCVALYSFDDFEKDPPITCNVDMDCPGSATCGQPQCDEGICTLKNLVAAGTLSINHQPGNCLRVICDGLGNEIIELDDTNVRPDGDMCTDDLCVDHTPVNPLSKAGTPCGPKANLECTDTGQCQGCVANTDCGNDSDCNKWTCENTICINNLEPVGKEIANPVAGDCKKTLCNAVGEAVDTFTADDAPSDEDPCTADYCSANGDILHDLLAEGTKCGDCMACTAAGLCQSCDAVSLDCSVGSCVPKPQPCTTNSDCSSSYCVDGYCCDSECSSKCVACNEAATGVHSGVCAPVKNGTDPNGDCQSATDTCIDGSCGCENGIKDGNETGTDCGGNCNGCTGTWNCGGIAACEGAVVPECCFLACINCPDDRELCKNLEGKTCVKGTDAQRIAIGAVTYNACAWPSNACRHVTCKCE